MHTHLQIQGVKSIEVVNRYFKQGGGLEPFYTCQLKIVSTATEPVFITLFSAEPLTLIEAIKEAPSIETS